MMKLRKIILTFLFVVLSVFTLGAAPVVPDAQCRTGYATLHNAWASVFANFPDRLDAEADGYIALADCDEIGQRKRLFFGKRWWRVVVADCLAQDATPAPGWIVDVDYRIWWQAYPYQALDLHQSMVCDGW